jgi:hypothetical protein
MALKFQGLLSSIAKGNSVFEFQSLLKQNDFESKPNFDWNLELSWGHTTMQTCFVPFLPTFPTLLGPSNIFFGKKMQP